MKLTFREIWICKRAIDHFLTYDPSWVDKQTLENLSDKLWEMMEEVHNEET